MFDRLQERHTGEYMKTVFKNTITSYGIEQKVLGLTADNAKNNDKMVELLEFALPDSPCGPSTQVGCLALASTWTG